jgi:hypothetical protein
MAAMLNTYICLGFSANAGAMIVSQGFANPEDLEQLTSEEVVGLCKRLRSPGGLIPNPVAVSNAEGISLPESRCSSPTQGEMPGPCLKRA